MALQSLPVDPVLPHLAIALDPELMRREFSRHLRCNQADDAKGSKADRSVTVNACSIRRVKYKPGRNCRVWYELDISGPQSGERACVWYSARMYAPHSSLSRYRKALDGFTVRPTVGPAVLHFVALGMVVWAFPNERKLDGLPMLVDPAALWSQVLPDVVREGMGEAWRIVRAHQSVASYAPEYTCSVRADLTLQHRETRQTHDWCVYGKTYYDDRGANTLELMRELYAASETCSAGLVVPRPLAYQPGTRSLWQESVPGITLHDYLRKAPHGPGLAAAGRAVATLHGLEVTPACQLGVASVVDRLPVLPDLLTHLGIGCADAAYTLVRQLERTAERMQENRPVLLHGDLHAKNILMPESTPGCSASNPVALIDLDTLAHGSPAHDLGSWIAALLYRALIDDRDLAATFARANDFVGAYREYAPTAVADADIRWYTAAALLSERAFRTLTRLKSGRLNHLADVISLASDVAGGRTVSFA